MTFSSAFRLPSSWKLWNTKPTLAARTAARSSSPIANRSTPSRRTVPVVGVSSPAMSESSVLLPDPDAPTMATERCRGRVKSISWRIVSVPVESCTRLVRRSTAMMGSDMKDGVLSGGDVDAPPLGRAL